MPECYSCQGEESDHVLLTCVKCKKTVCNYCSEYIEFYGGDICYDCFKANQAPNPLEFIFPKEERKVDTWKTFVHGKEIKKGMKPAGRILLRDPVTGVIECKDDEELKLITEFDEE